LRRAPLAVTASARRMGTLSRSHPRQAAAATAGAHRHPQFKTTGCLISGIASLASRSLDARCGRPSQTPAVGNPFQNAGRLARGPSSPHVLCLSPEASSSLRRHVLGLLANSTQVSSPIMISPREKPYRPLGLLFSRPACRDLAIRARASRICIILVRPLGDSRHPSTPLRTSATRVGSDTRYPCHGSLHVSARSVPIHRHASISCLVARCAQW